MKLYNVGTQVPGYPFKEVQDQWHRPILWITYYYKVRHNDGGDGYLVAWDGQNIIAFTLWHGADYSPFAHFESVSRLFTREQTLNANASEWVPDEKVILKAKKLILHDMSGLEAPDCVVADWYEDQGELEKVSILRESL